MDQIAQVREKTDIVALIAEYITVKKAGRNFKANCPFHQEKTPSFVISPERQIWHCFGCGKGGDCYTFLMEYEHMEFAESLRTLARKTGIVLAQNQLDLGTTSRKEELYKINRIASEFYHYILTNHNAGKRALAYLSQSRKINPKVISTFLLGFAPGVGNTLSSYLVKKKGYKQEALIAAGLSVQRTDGIRDFFMNRLMFPIIDHRGNIVGFSGRSLISSDTAPKYINTRETFIYHKGSVFFGLDIAKAYIKKENAAIIMEGEFDVISSFQQGVCNAIAIKGTALTDDQAMLIGRFTKKVSLCFDQDDAGELAVKRSLAALEKQKMTITVIETPGGKDPDEAIKNDPIAFVKAVKKDNNVYDYLLAKTLQKYDRQTGEGKRRIGDDLLPLYNGIENEIVKEHFLKKLATTLDTSLESIRKQVLQYGVKKQSAAISTQQKEQRTREDVLGEYLLALLLQYKDVSHAVSVVTKIIGVHVFASGAIQALWKKLILFVQAHTIFDARQFVQSLSPSDVAVFDQCFLLPLSPFDEEKHVQEIKKIGEEVRVLALRTKLKMLAIKIKEREQLTKETEDSELDQLRAQFAQVVALIKTVL